MTNSNIVNLVLTFDHTGNLDLTQASRLVLKAYTLAQNADMAALDIVIATITRLLQSNRQINLPFPAVFLST